MAIVKLVHSLGTTSMFVCQVTLGNGVREEAKRKLVGSQGYA